MRLALAALCLLSFSLHAQDKSNQGQAQWMLERLTGVHWPANSPVITSMANKLANGDAATAADIAMQQPQFLNVKVKQMALKMSTREFAATLSVLPAMASTPGSCSTGTSIIWPTRI